MAILLRGVNALGAYSKHDMDFPDSDMLSALAPAILDGWAGAWAHKFAGQDWVMLRVERSIGPGIKLEKTYTKVQLDELAIAAAAKEAANKRKAVMMYRGDAALFGFPEAVFNAGLLPAQLGNILASRGLKLKGSGRDPEPAYPGFVWLKVTDHMGEPVVFQPSSEELLVVTGADGKPRTAKWAQLFDVDGIPYQADALEVQRMLREAQENQRVQMQMQAEQAAYMAELRKEIAELRKENAKAKKVVA